MLNREKCHTEGPRLPISLDSISAAHLDRPDIGVQFGKLMEIWTILDAFTFTAIVVNFLIMVVKQLPVT